VSPLDPDLEDIATPEEVAALDRLADAQSRTEAEARADAAPPTLEAAVRRAEAVLFAAGEPVDAQTLAQALPQGTDVARVLMALQQDYAGRGVELAEVAGRWRFQTAPDLAFLFQRKSEEPRRLSRAALETLAIIAYSQPVTRGEIEAVRGVSASKGTFDVLLEAGFIRPRGRRRTPGRPLTFGTTDKFLEHFGLASLDHLPGREDLKAAELLAPDALDTWEGLGMPRPADTAEDPLDAGDDTGLAAEAPGQFHLDFVTPDRPETDT
jgi:segregation and condensation protein B